MQTFVIRRAFLIPLGLLLALCLTLGGVVVLQHQSLAKLAVLAVMTAPIGLFFFAALLRRIEIDEREIRAIRPGGGKCLPLAAVTTLDALTVRKRVLLTVSAGDDYIIISNGYADFAALLAALRQRVPAAALSPEVERLGDTPPRKHSDVITLWLLDAVMVYVLVAQFIRPGSPM